MNWTIATNQQLKSIIEQDGECSPHLLYGALEEVVRRDLYNNYIVRLINRRYKAIKYLEYLTKLTFDEIKLLSYEQMFEALKFYKPGKCPFIQFWPNFIHTAFNYETRKYRTKMRTAEFVYMDETPIQIVDDHNLERKVVNRVYLEQLLSVLTSEDRMIFLQYNNDSTFAEIGKQIGRSREHVRKKYYKTVEKLREIGA